MTMAPSAQEYHKHHDDQQHANQQGVGDGLQGFAHQVGAVEERMYLHALGQNLVVQLVDGGVYAVQNFRGVLAAQHLYDAFHSIVVVVLVVAVAQHAFALQGAIFQLAQVFQIDGCAVDGFHHDVAQSIQVADEADATDDVAETALGEDTTAGIDVVLFYLLGYIAQRDAVFGQPVGRELYLVLCGDAAVVAYVGHA